MNRLDDMCVKPCHCDHLLSHETVVVEYQGKDWHLDLDRIRWSKWYGSVIIEVDIHERPGSTGVSKSRRKINVRGDNQSGILMTLKNHAGFYYFSLFLGLITGCCSGKWALTHWPPPPPPHTPHPLLWKSYSGRINDWTWKTAEIELSMATVLMIISLDGDVQFTVGLVSSLSIQRGCKRTYAVWEKV